MRRLFSRSSLFGNDWENIWGDFDRAMETMNQAMSRITSSHVEIIGQMDPEVPSDKGGHYEYQIAVPGLNANEISVYVRGGLVEVSGVVIEGGDMKRAKMKLNLPGDADTETIICSLKLGVLTVTAQKGDKSPRGRKIEVNEQ